MKTIFLYSDASFNKELQIGVAGWFVFETELDHQSSKINIDEIKTIYMREVNNIRVEIKGVLAALEKLEANNLNMSFSKELKIYLF